MTRCGEAGHVHPDLGNDLLGAGPADAGDLIKLGHLTRERGQALVDPLGQRVNLGGDRVDAVAHHPQQVPVMVAEVPGQRFRRTLILPRMLPRASPASASGSRCPAMSASSSAPDLPKMSLITDDSFTWVSSSSFSARCFSRVRSWTGSAGTGTGPAAPAATAAG